MYVSESLDFDLPTYFDPDQDLVTLTVTQQFSTNLPTFIKRVSKTLKLNPDFSDYGTYNLIIKIQDSKGASNYHLLPVYVLKYSKYRGSPPQNQSQNQTQNNTHNQSDSLDYLGDLAFDIIQISSSGEDISLMLRLLSISMSNKDGSSSNLYSWNLTSFQGNSMTFKLNFQDNLQVSSEQDFDVLKIDLKSSNNQGSQNQASKTMPPQFPDKETKQVEESAYDGLATILTAALYGSIGVSMIAGTSIQTIWSLINTLQLVSHTPLFHIPFTINVIKFLKALFSVVNFDIFQIADNLQFFFQLKSSDDYPAYNDSFELLGYDNSNFVYLIGTPILYMVIYVLFVILFLMIFPLKYCCSNKIFRYIYEKLRNDLFFANFMRFFIELILESTLACIINHKLKSVDNYGEWASYLLSFFFVAMNLILAIWIPAFFIYKRDHLEDETIQQYLGALNDGLNVQKSFYNSISFHHLFVTRRLIFVVTVFWLPDYLILQIHLFLLGNLFQLIYLIAGNPLEEGKFVEIFNESCTLVDTYLLYTFTDILQDPHIKYRCGYYFISIYVLNMAVNLVIMTYEFIVDIYHKLRKIYWMIKIRRAVKKKFLNPLHISDILRQKQFHNSFLNNPSHFIDTADQRNPFMPKIKLESLQVIPEEEEADFQDKNSNETNRPLQKVNLNLSQIEEHHSTLNKSTAKTPKSKFYKPEGFTRKEIKIENLDQSRQNQDDFSSLNQRTVGERTTMQVKTKTNYLNESSNVEQDQQDESSFQNQSLNASMRELIESREARFLPLKGKKYVRKVKKRVKKKKRNGFQNDSSDQIEEECRPIEFSKDKDTSLQEEIKVEDFNNQILFKSRHKKKLEEITNPPRQNYKSSTQLSTKNLFKLSDMNKMASLLPAQVDFKTEIDYYSSSKSKQKNISNQTAFPQALNTISDYESLNSQSPKFINYAKIAPEDNIRYQKLDQISPANTSSKKTYLYKRESQKLGIEISPQQQLNYQIQRPQSSNNLI